MTPEEMRKRITQDLAKKELLSDQLETISMCKNSTIRVKLHQEKARLILQQIATTTQQNLQYHISAIVTKALQDVFDGKLQFECVFESKRGRTECQLLFRTENGDLLTPIDSSGGGAIDIASFALRLTFWALKNSRGVLIFDEPFKFLSCDLWPKAAQMLQSLAKNMGVQIIMVTHIPDFIEVADKAFKITKKNGISHAEIL